MDEETVSCVSFSLKHLLFGSEKEKNVEALNMLLFSQKVLKKAPKTTL
jgi:hypothetical protein